MYDVILTPSLRYSDIVKKIWYHIGYHIAIMIPGMISYLFDIIIVTYPIIPIPCAIFFVILPTISYTYHTKSHMISVSYDMTHDIGAYNSNFWYHSHVISRIQWYVRLYHGTCAAEAARRDGAGWGSQLSGAPPPPASPSPTCWAVSGDCCSAERRRPGFRAWTCCSRCCQVSSWRWKFSSCT
jgi:hypothetical protein